MNTTHHFEEKSSFLKASVNWTFSEKVVYFTYLKMRGCLRVKRPNTSMCNPDRYFLDEKIPLLFSTTSFKVRTVNYTPSSRDFFLDTARLNTHVGQHIGTAGLATILSVC